MENVGSKMGVGRKGQKAVPRPGESVARAKLAGSSESPASGILANPSGSSVSVKRSTSLCCPEKETAHCSGVTVAWYEFYRDIILEYEKKVGKNGATAV
jgi:hypothetical protein